MQPWQNPDTESILVSIKQSNDPASKFFRQENVIQKLFVAAFSSVIYLLWAARIVPGIIELLILGSIYLITVFLLTTMRYENLQTERVEDHSTFTYTRSGVSWQGLLETIIGSSIVLVSVYFLASNAIVDYPLFTDFIAIVAVIIHVLIVPLHPLLSNTNLRILKTKVIWSFKENDISLNLLVHRLDIPWSRDFGQLNEEIKLLLSNILSKEQEAPLSKTSLG